jgi:DNA replication protein DnaC
MLLRHNLKTLRLPTMLSEHAKLSREAAEADESYEQFLLRLTELEVNQRAANAVQARIKAAGFPVLKDLDTYDFAAMPSLSKQKILELSRGEWIDQKFNACFIGNAGTGKTHLAIALGQAACRQHKRVRFFTAATLVNTLEELQKQYRLDRFLAQLDKAELLFQVFADRYERGSTLITSNLPFSEWGQVFQGERMTAALLDRFTHRCHIFEMNGESFRFRESAKQAKERKLKSA